MLKVVVSLVLFLVVGNCYAQTATIKGTVKDQTNVPIEYAELTLKGISDSTFFKNMPSNAKGEFLFAEVPYGIYVVVAEYYEFEKVVSDRIRITSEEPFEVEIQLKAIRSNQMNEIVVKAERPLVRLEDGKTIMDVENTMSNSGQTAIEVLRKAPGVAVDQDGKIQLKGKGGVQVMIDDKTMYLSEDQLASLLRAIPSDQIKEIELMTSPSAKFDAVGNAGIINIKLKKGAYEGLNGRINGSYGTGVYHKATAGVNLTYKKKKWNVNLGYQFADRIGLSSFYNDRTNYEPLALYDRVYSKTYYKTPMRTHSFQVSGDYQASKNTSVNFDFNNNLGSHPWRGASNAYVYSTSKVISNTFSTVDKGTLLAANSYSSIGFKHKLDTLGTTLSGYGAFNYNIGDKNKQLTIDYYDGLGNNLNTPFVFEQKNKFHSNHYIGQLDFTKKIFKKIKLESGVKHNRLESFNPNAILVLNNGTTSDESNRFFYGERIYAAYAMGSSTFKKWNLQGGLRLEHTDIEAKISLIDTTYKRNYTNLFPSGSISFKQSEKVSYSLAYSRRITRPTGEQLNPIINVLDPYTAWGGDPFILPQYANNTDFTYSLFGGTLLTSINYTFIRRPIVWATQYDAASGKFISGFRNLDYQNNYGLSVSYNKSLRTWWATSNNLVVNNSKFVGDAGFGKINNQLTSWTLKSTQTINLPKNIGIEISGQYDSPSSYAYSYQNARWQANLALQKKFWAKKALLKIAVNDMFWTYYYGGNSDLGKVYQKMDYKWDNRTVIVSFSYKFGNPLMKSE